MDANTSQQGVLVPISEYRTLILLQIKYDMICEVLKNDNSNYGLSTESEKLMRMVTGIKRQEEETE